MGRPKSPCLPRLHPSSQGSPLHVHVGDSMEQSGPDNVKLWGFAVDGPNFLWSKVHPGFYGAKCTQAFI